jgi:hypothetical protein
MNHLKSYKLFESKYNATLNSDNIKDYIEDILLPLSDVGIEVDVSIKERRDNITFIEIYLNKRGGMHNKDVPGFELTPFIGELNQLNNYLESEGWILNNYVESNYSFKQWIDNVESSKSSYSAVPIFYVPNINNKT